METTTETISHSTAGRRRAVRESLQRLAAGALTPLQSFATNLRSRLPFFSGAAIVTYDDRLDVTLEVPGVEAVDVEVSIDGSTLNIRWTKNEQREQRANGYYRMERYCRAFQRVLVLRRPIDLDKTAATLKNGVLEVRLPLAKSGNGVAHRKQVPVRAE